MAALEKVTFSEHSHEHIECFVVHEEPYKGQKRPGKIRGEDLAERDIVVAKCLNVHKRDNHGAVAYEVRLGLEYREHEVLSREEIVDKVGRLLLLVARCQGQHG